MNLFNRCWQLKIQLPNQRAKIYQKLTQDDVGFAIDFKVEDRVNSVAAHGSLTITGLLKDDVDYLATNYYAGSVKAGQEKEAAKVELSAGYEGSLSLILYGNIYETVPVYSNTADYSISMKVMNGNAANAISAFSSTSIKGRATLRDIFAGIAHKLGFTLELDPGLTNRVLVDYSFQGSASQQLDSLEKMFGDLLISRQNNNLKVSRRDTQPKVKYKLTAETGLLGVPQPTSEGVQLTTYLLPNLSSQDGVEVESHILPQLNGVYRIRAISHQGSTRGNTWQSTLACQRTK